MNSKSEYNRCEIARLVLGEGGGGVDVGEDEEAKEQQIREWVNARAIGKVIPDTKKTSDLRKTKVKVKRKTTKAKDDKEGNEDDLTQVEEDDRPKKRRKFKHKVLERGWGCIAKVVSNHIEYVPQPQRQGCRMRGSRLLPSTTVATVAAVPVPEDRLRCQDIRQMLTKVKTANTTLKEKIYRREDSATFADLCVGTGGKERRSKRARKTEERKKKGFGPLDKYLTPTNTRDREEDVDSSTPPSGTKRKLCSINEDEHRELLKVGTHEKRVRTEEVEPSTVTS